MEKTNIEALGHEMLFRPRVNDLIRKGLEQPLLILLAGPGYGKSHAMSSYVDQTDASVLWLRLRPLDNLPAQFWAHLMGALEKTYPDLSPQLHRLPFPDTISYFDAFASLLTHQICKGTPVIWVFDDYGEIENRQVNHFVRMLAEADLDHFRLVLISNVLHRMESIAFMSRKRSLLLAGDLRFNKEEIGQLYALCRIPLSPDALDAVERYTQGWPLALQLLVQGHDPLPDAMYRNTEMTHQVISQLFEEHFFSAYSRPFQELLIKLSLLKSFTPALLTRLVGDTLAESEPLVSHAFFVEEPATERIIFHHLYRCFLQEKSASLSQDVLRQTWVIAAQYHMEQGGIIEAVSCYEAGEDYKGMLEAISLYVESENETSTVTGLYFLEAMARLTGEQRANYPRTDYLEAWVYMLLVELEKAESILLQLKDRLLEEDAARRDFPFLCDVNAALGLVHMMQNRETLWEDFRDASDCFDQIPPEQRLPKRDMLRMQNGHAFSMADALPGAKERMERTVHKAVPYITKIWQGNLSGLEHLFSAEGAYLSLQLDSAQQHAYRGLYKAENHRQYDMACNARLLLARIGHLQGDFEEMTRQIESLREYAGKHDAGVVRKIRDTALGWYYAKLHEYQRIPKSILELSRTEHHSLGYGRPELVYGHCLVGRGEYAKLISIMRQPMGLYLTRGIWPDRISMFVMLAICYHRLGDDDAAIEQLHKAYQMCYHNQIITLFIEGEQYMRELIPVARRQSRYPFSAQWLDLIETESAAFALRAKEVRAAYRRQNPVQWARDNPLSRRERDVLQAIAQGLTREEIAVEQLISVNTVKSTIRNIYNKLNANNKAEAVSIAITRGYIEGYSPL